MKLGDYDVSFNKLSLTNYQIIELILIHRKDNSKNLIIHNANKENLDSRSVIELEKRRNRLSIRMKIPNYIIHDDSAYRKMILSEEELIHEILNQKKIFLKIIEINKTDFQDSRILNLLAIYFHEKEIDEIAENELDKLLVISKEKFRISEIESNLKNSIFIKEKNNFFSFNLNTCNHYFIAQEFNQYNKTNYNGIFEREFNFQIVNFIEFENIPNELQQKVDKINEIKLLMNKAIDNQMYEKAADLRDRRFDYFNSEIRQIWKY